MVRLKKELWVMSVKAHHVMHDEPRMWPAGQPPASMGTPDLHAEVELCETEITSLGISSGMRILKSQCEQLGIPFGHDLLGKLLIFELESSPAPLDASGQNINFENPSLVVAHLKDLWRRESVGYANWVMPHRETPHVLHVQSNGNKSPSGFYTSIGLQFCISESDYQALLLEAVVPLIFKLTISCKEMDFSPPKN